MARPLSEATDERATRPPGPTSVPVDWLSARRPILRAALVFLGGAVAGLGQAPFSLPVLTMVALALVMAMQDRVMGKRGAFLDGWAFGAGYFALTLHWIVEPFLIDVARHGWMAPFALVFLSAGLALFWGAAFAGARWIGRGGDWDLVALVALWTGAEALRSYVLTGFPWALIGHIWIETPLAQLVAYVGPHGLTLLTLAGVALAVVIGMRVLLFPPLALVAAGWYALDPGPVPEAAPDAQIVRLVQPNAPQSEKWDDERIAFFYTRMLRLTAEGPVPDLVVWPETAVPWLLEYAHGILEEVAEAARGAPVALGIQRRDGTRYFNSLAVIGRTGEVTALYDKAHLVPFGEYVPFGETMARFGIHGLAASEGGGYSAGERGALVDVPGIGTAMPLICYEGIFAQGVADHATRPRLLLLITNDAWFGQVAGPYQHFAQGRLRAIEQGLPMVRVANTGVSGMIDPKGRVIDSLALGEAGAIDVALPPALAPTLYARTGDWPVLLLLLVVAAALSFKSRRSF
jgi:apolipoprotein N-acyltransferase